MKKLFIVFLFLFLGLVAEKCVAEKCEACTEAVATVGDNILIVTYTCTAAADGSFTDTTTSADVLRRILGTDPYSQGGFPWLYEIRTNPGATAPTALYDIVVNDTDGIDLAGGSLANRSATVSERVTPWATVDGALTIGVSNNTQNAGVTVIKLFFAR